MTERRTWVEVIRYGGDRPVDQDVPVVDAAELIGHMVQSELAITESVTPALARCLKLAADRLGVPPSAYAAFVYPAPVPQASCFIVSPERCIVRFSSGLIELLEPAELCFVAGHELGHFVYQHGRVDGDSTDVDLLRQRRAQEISVDRAGMLAADSLESALAAIVKLVSGLGGRHLRFDIVSFLSQLDAATPSLIVAGQSHPSLLVRARALLWFSMIDWRASKSSATAVEQLRKLDDKIARDIVRFIDEPVDEILRTVQEELSLWTTVHRLVRPGSFSRAQQQLFAGQFGAELLTKIVSYLQDKDTPELLKWADGHLAQSTARVVRIVPGRQRAMELAAGLTADAVLAN